jgi:hypothetical protein
MIGNLRSAWEADDGQDNAEYAVMLAVILVIVVGSIRLIGSNASDVFLPPQARSNKGLRSPDSKHSTHP